MIFSNQKFKFQCLSVFLRRSKELEIELDKSQKENTVLRQQLTELRSQHEKNMALPPSGYSVPGAGM